MKSLRKFRVNLYRRTPPDRSRCTASGLHHILVAVLDKRGSRRTRLPLLPPLRDDATPSAMDAPNETQFVPQGIAGEHTVEKNQKQKRWCKHQGGT